MKRLVDNLDAVPSKRLFQSIIADYDINKSVCELIDNALDVWVRGGRTATVAISISLDTRQQTITVRGNAGGVHDVVRRMAFAHWESRGRPTTIGMTGSLPRASLSRRNVESVYWGLRSHE
jgi:hypothetical protein